MHLDLLTALNFKAIINKSYIISKDQVRMSNKLLKKGIFVEPSLLSKFNFTDVNMLINQYGYDLKEVNSTFYKSFEEMKSKSEFELRIDQILHYLSTYGEIKELRNHGDIYEPNSLEEAEIAAASKLLKAFVVIEHVNQKEFDKRYQSVIESGIAMNHNKVYDMFLIYDHFVDDYKEKFDINNIKNKELKTTIAQKYQLALKDVPDTIKIIAQEIFGSPLYTHSMIDSIESQLKYSKSKSNNVSKILQNYVMTYGYKRFAQSANRYRKLLLRLRRVFVYHNDSVGVSVINKITRLAKTTKQVDALSDMMRVTEGSMSLVKFSQVIENMSIYQLIRLYNTINDRLLTLQETKEYVRLFKIRNGKVFVKKTVNDENAKSLSDTLNAYMFMLKAQIKSVVNVEDKIVVDPQIIKYAAPTSEKSFIGDIPEYSRYESENGLRIGVSWNQESDIDLHSYNTDGRHSGWNGRYVDDGSYYSGDMTCLNKHGFAAEYFDFSENYNDTAQLTLSYYYLNKLTSYKFILGEPSSNKKIMHDVDSIKHYVEMKYQGNLGVVTKIDDKLNFVFNSGTVSSSRVPDDDLSVLAVHARERLIKSRLMMSDLYDMLNVKVVNSIDEVDEADHDKVIDLSIETLSLDKFTTLLS